MELTKTTLANDLEIRAKLMKRTLEIVRKHGSVLCMVSQRAPIVSRHIEEPVDKQLVIVDSLSALFTCKS